MTLKMQILNRPSNYLGFT